MKPTYEELEQQLADSQREFRAADAAVDNLQMQLEKMAAENAGLKESRQRLAEFIHEELDAGYPLNMNIETQATDAYLDEVRASTIETCADDLASQNNIGAHEHNAMYIYAAQLRKGVQS